MKYKFILLSLLTLATLQSCKQKTDKVNTTRFLNDSAKVAVDESFRPIVDEELYIFKALYNNVHPRVQYVNEADAVNLLLNDSVGMAIMSRDLTKQEYQTIANRHLSPIIDRFAIDAVTLIVNSASTDTTITVSDIKKMLNGNTKQDKNIVFDNPNSSLVRYLKDFSGVKDFKQKNIYSLKSDKEVIKYVSQHPNAIGITSFSWLNDPDKDYADDLQKIKIVSVMDENNKKYPGQYFSPSQNTLALKQYPLTRDLLIVNFTGNYGLGMKIDNFLISDRGQRIILKSGLLPDDIPARRINIVKKLKQ